MAMRPYIRSVRFTARVVGAIHAVSHRRAADSRGTNGEFPLHIDIDLFVCLASTEFPNLHGIMRDVGRD